MDSTLDLAIAQATDCAPRGAQAPVTPTSDAYPLQRDAAEHARLQAQARFWSHEAAALFATANLGAGGQVADLGCGTLDVAEVLAARVGPAGRVRALDNDARLLGGVAGRSATESAARIDVEVGDAYATGWPDRCLDAAHARFLAAPAGRLDALLQEMRRIVCPGGLILLQEPDGDSWHIDHAGPAWTALHRLIREGFARRGGDFDAGRHVAGAMARHGLDAIEERRVTRVLDHGHPYASLPLAFARQLRDVWLKEGLIAEHALDSLLDEVREALQRRGTSCTFTLVQTWGRVPA